MAYVDLDIIYTPHLLYPHSFICHRTLRSVDVLFRFEGHRKCVWSLWLNPLPWAALALYPACRFSPDHAPPSFVLPCFASIYTFLFSGKGLLSTFNWCSERTSATEGVFPMHHPCREMYSTPTSSSNTLTMAVYCWVRLANILLKTFASKFIKTITLIFFHAILVCFSMKTVLAS